MEGNKRGMGESNHLFRMRSARRWKRLKKSHNPVEKALPRHLQRIIGRTLGLLDARERGGTERGEEEGREERGKGGALNVFLLNAPPSRISNVLTPTSGIPSRVTC